MATASAAKVRHAEQHDIAALHSFGETHIPPHYTPLIGAEAANNQVRDWWNTTHLTAAVNHGLIVVAEANEQLVGVGQRGRNGAEHVIYKLYLHPLYRGNRLGPRLIAAIVNDLPPDATRLNLEHFRANERAGRFYEREGFTIDRIEPNPDGDPALDVVWRVRTMPTRSSRAAQPSDVP